MGFLLQYMPERILLLRCNICTGLRLSYFEPSVKVTISKENQKSFLFYLAQLCSSRQDYFENSRRLEIRLPVSGFECCPGYHPFVSLKAGTERSNQPCHPERSVQPCH